jgi:CHAD domain-containing protein
MPFNELRKTLERELKLGIGSHFRFPKFRGSRLKPRTFTSIYYDTPDYRLAKAGVTLRRRVQDGHGLWQLKLPIKAARREIEYPDGPNPAVPPETLLRPLVALLRGRRVIPIAKLRTRRVGTRVTDAGSQADVVLDTVAVLDGKRVARRFSELEVELTRGDESVLGRLEKTLREAGAGDGDTRPKVLHALGLKLPASTPLPSSAPAVEHFKHALLVQVEALLAHDAGIRIENDPEDVHQMRVATARLRAYLRAARPMLQPEWVEELRKELAWLGHGLGAVRDLDVLLERLRAESPHLNLPERRALNKVLRLFEPDRAKARAELLDALHSPRYFQLLDRLDAAADTPRVVDASASLKEIAARQFKKLRRAMRDLPSTPTDQAIHRIRIKAKRARYAAELAEVTVGKPATRFIERSKDFQDLVGRHQDAIVIEERLRKRLGQTHGTIAAFTLGRLVERQRGYRQAVREVLAKEMKNLARYGKKVWCT